MSVVRTRFAPSPTGFLHIGTIRTALFAWLLAKHHNGQFILRIEDTDQKREVDGSIEHIIKCLKSLGINYDEGPDVPGPYGPYLQSQRLSHYREWADKLIKDGRAYADSTSPEALAQLRIQAQKDHIPFLYRNHRPANPPIWDGKTPLRFKSEPQDYTWDDAVMGKLSAPKEVVDDFVIIKSDGFPTYNFAHIVDDTEMKITHVIRGHEFLPSVPNYLNLYQALDIGPPIFVTPPPVLGPTGNKKLSKRDGAKDLIAYLEEGYLEEALINFIVSLGWNDGTTKEIYTINELIKAFSTERIQKSGARFDEQRLLWMNGSYIRSLSLEQLYDRTDNFWPPEAQQFPKSYRINVLRLVQERLKYLAELPSLTNYFFIDLAINPDLIDNNKKLKSINKEELRSLLNKAIATLRLSDFSEPDITERLNQLLQATNQTPPVLFGLIRIATTQVASSPPLASSLEVLGKQKVLDRLNAQLEYFVAN